MFDIAIFEAKLEEFDALRDEDEIQTETVERIQPQFADGWSARLNPAVRDALIQTGISRPYQHQADAISRALDDVDVVMESPTATVKRWPSPRRCSTRSCATGVLMP